MGAEAVIVADFVSIENGMSLGSDGVTRVATSVDAP